jgi:hypothetical protein
MQRNMLGAAVALLLLSACAHSYPELAKFAPPPQADASDEVAPILQEAHRLQGQYAIGYKATAERKDLAQLPVIGAAATAAWILLNNHDHAASRAAKIGIGALTYTSVRDQLTASDLPDAYVAGHGALTCVLAEGSMFSGHAAKSRYMGLTRALTDIATWLHQTNEWRYKEPVDATDHAVELKNARTVADQAMVAGRAAESASLMQEASYLGAAPAFRNAVSSISVRVATRGRVRPDVDFNTLRNQMAPPKPPAVGATPESRALMVTSDQRPDATTVIEKMMAATNALMSSTSRLTAATPKYSDSLTQVAKCPEKVTIP